MENKNDYKKRMLNKLKSKRNNVFRNSKSRLFDHPELAPDLNLSKFKILVNLFKKFEDAYYKYIKIEKTVKKLEHSKSRMDDKIIPDILEEQNEQLKIMYDGIDEFLHGYSKYVIYTMYREKLLKIYALISKNL